MGTKVAPTYANIFMHNLETKLLSQMEITPQIWRRFIDDIFAIYRCTEDELKEHLNHLNRLHHSIKFTYEYSQSEINYLDTTVYIDKNRKLQTKVYRKPTDSHLYLHYNSCHPKHQKDSIAYSQAIRLRTICSTEINYQKAANELLKFLTSRGHPHTKVKTAIQKAGLISRIELLKMKKTPTKPIIPFIIEYNPHNLRASGFLREAKDLFSHRACNRKFHMNNIIIAYKRGANLRDVLTSSSFPKEKTRNISRPCMRLSCNTCENIVITDSITSLHNGKKFKIKGNNTCQSRNVVYAIMCPICSKLYIGETGRTASERLRDHKYNIRNRRRDLPVASHFLDHDLQERDLLCIILDNTPSDKNVRLRLEEAWIRVLDSITPHGMNLKW